MNVLIVESAAKSRTLQKYLGDDWSVVATGGHVETLPNDRKVSGKDAKKAYWANRAGELPSPPWVWTDRGEKAVGKILDAAGDDPVFWIATDPDREGEFIAWCLERHLRDHGPTHRVTFQEVTREAVERALERPREVDGRMVDSALVRKFLDRMVGFRASRTAGSIVGRGASMGRVQTPTLGFVVERELEREAFVPTPYFEVRAVAAGQDLQVRFHESSDPDRWEDREGKYSAVRTFDQELAEQAFGALEAEREVTITAVRSPKPKSRRAPTPFATDSLLQEAGSRLGWSPKKTSALASMLYEAGQITYIRTDSTRLADSADAQVRAVIKAEHGEEYLGKTVKEPESTGPVQDAHEAIRPTRLDTEETSVDDADARKLYRLIRARTLASRMKPSIRESRRVDAACAGFDRTLRGTISWQTFAGWEAAYREFRKTPPSAPPAIPIETGAVWTLDDPVQDSGKDSDEATPNPRFIEDETRPPARYRPHTLVRQMKDEGIGRPSTYARTIEKLEERGYVEPEEGALVPTPNGRTAWLEVAPLYTRDSDNGSGEDTELFSAEFTSVMENGLDEVASGTTAGPERWEAWRDEIRDLHNIALERKKSGGMTPKQARLLARMLENAPAGVDVPEDRSGMTYRDALELMDDLRTQGVEPVPSKKQIAYVESLIEQLRLSDEEVTEIVGEGGPSELRTADGASEIIERLKTRLDEERPPSRKQLRWIEDLLKETETTRDEAAEMVDSESFDDLTGGQEGTASALIDALLEVVRRKKAEGAEAAG